MYNISNELRFIFRTQEALLDDPLTPPKSIFEINAEDPSAER